MPSKPPNGGRQAPPRATKPALKPDQEMQVMTGLMRELSAFLVQATRIAKQAADEMERAAKADAQQRGEE